MVTDHKRWRNGPAAFMEEALINPDGGGHFVLLDVERVFLEHAFTPDANGDLPYKDILWSCIKKSGKSTFGAMCMLYTVVCLGGRFAEAYIISNDWLQSQSRIFTIAAKIVESSPLLSAKITSDKITFGNGRFIQALASDYRGGAGVEPCFVIADEIWGFSSESSNRLWEEVCPTPTRHPSVRMVTSYAGFSGESSLLEGLVKRGMAGTEVAKDLRVQPGMVAFISHDRIAPWQTEAWIEEARLSTRPSAFLRQYQNEFTSGESSFVDMDDWDACTDPDLSPELHDPALPIWIGVDASTKHDSTAIAAATYDMKAKKIRLVFHRIWQPTRDTPLNFEATIEATLLDLRRRFNVRSIKYDPWQMSSVAQRLAAAGLPIEEFPQTSGNLTEASTTLYEAIRGHNLAIYPAADVRLAISHAIAVESGRGWKISKSLASHKVDIAIALAQAVLGAMMQGQESARIEFTPVSVKLPRDGAGWSESSDGRLFANGSAIAAREDAAAARSATSGRKKWAGF